ncbi:MAG: hypothetical protein GYA87_07715 [Christensenellaceae bacterium]|nr:hypothetical protein [Christensenellaceae bacterium]
MDKSFAFADDRRINNLIWAGAHAYDFAPDFASHDISGQPDFYMNLIVGCAYFRYGRENLNELFDIWQGSHRLSLLDQLTWLALESAIYPEEAKVRPALEELRQESASVFLKPEFDLQRRNFSIQNWLLFELKRAKSLEVLALPQAKMSNKTRIFYEAFKFEETPDFAEFRELLLQLYKTHFGLSTEKRQLSPFKRRLYSFLQKLNRPLVTRISASTNFQKNELSEGRITTQGFEMPWLSFMKREDERLKTRLSYEFGSSIFNEAEQLALEDKYARDQHKGSRLWICHQRENYPKAKGSDDLYLQFAAMQKKQTFKAYRRRQAFYRQSIQRLANYLQLMIATDLAPGYNPSRYGNLDGCLAFKYKIPGQDKIFHRHAEVPAAEHSVDLFLDASASRIGQVEDIAIQTYILAESLERCTIPVRIVAYCTLQQYTILTILKDFSEPLNLNKLFSYHSLGWNRDGLAYRAMEALLPKRPCHNHLMLILTDAAPNDLRPLQGSWKLPQPYSDKAGLQDAAEGLDTLRKPGIKIAALISGKEPHENIHKLFGNKYERLNDTSQLVSKAKKLIYMSV